MKKANYFALAFVSVYSFVGLAYADSVCSLEQTTTPACQNLGYTQNADCAENAITCPFDSSYKWCQAYTCADGRYESEDLNSCIPVLYHGKTCYNCACSGYPLTECSTGSNCLSCSTEGYTRYQFIGCADGYRGMRDHVTYEIRCIPRDCSTYALEACPTGGSCSECIAGTTHTYRLDSCAEGYTQDGDTCTPNACTDYTLTACPLNAASCATCQSGTVTKYRLTACPEGYTVDSNSCTPNDCSAYPLSECPTGAAECTRCLSGTTVSYKATSCSSGYTYLNGTCFKCDGYSTSTCDDYAVCQACTDRLGTRYKVSGCQTGYDRLDDETPDCSIYLESYGTSKVAAIKALRVAVPSLGLKAAKELVDATPATVATDVSYTAATTFKTTVESYDGSVTLDCPGRCQLSEGAENTCQTGYTYSETEETCVENDCSGYILSTCPLYATSCSVCRSGTKMSYRADGCREGYDQIVVVYLAEVGSNKVQVIKAVRTYTGLGLKDSKTLIDKAPTVIASTSDYAGALAFKADAEEVGATVILTPEGQCVAKTCSDTAVSSCPEGASCTPCLSGTTLKYQVETEA